MIILYVSRFAVGTCSLLVGLQTASVVFRVSTRLIQPPVQNLQVRHVTSAN
jgi:hypothetical protein